jgi:hypothetical protein
MGVWFLSKMEMERCAHVWGEESHELGVWFLSETKMECCVPLCEVRKPMIWVCRSLGDGDEMMYWSPLCRELR